MNNSAALIPESIVEEASVVEVAVESMDLRAVDETQQANRRHWDHGSTQTTDDMYLGGLMCE